ncbi:hypothetical protein A3E42_02940 [Candidatus Gottesmanbacteria bacterium RIFCSPHIGHO2_12_FULL_40_13]|nr:MAG: hypothetical protein A3E42_02940 [Candidatus Gottesmanbacteria bacterium RIFCSPHIGHO2_12_FULL_40_13]
MRNYVLLLLLIPVFFLSLPTVSSVYAQTVYLVCLDPGHGGNSGAFNPSYNLWEDEINLDAANRLKNLLLADGKYRVEMTRTDNSFKSNNDRYTFCNSISADILVSIHVNSSTNPSIDGSMALYFKPGDKVLAKQLLDVLFPALNNTDWTFTNFGLSKYASGVLLKSDMPAAMMETVMLSHDGEAQLLSDTGETSRREQVAQALYDGIEAYFAGNPDGGGGNGGGKCQDPPCRK